MSRTSLCGLEILACEGSGLVVEAGLSITVEAGWSEAVADGFTPVASVLCSRAKGFSWSVVKLSVIIPVPKTAKITPSRIPIPSVVPVVTTSASP